MELKSDLSKEYIADALIDLMRKKDFSSITNKEITDRAGLSHITIYRNFKNKEEIVKYYLNNVFSKWKWDDKNNIAFNIFSFFQENKEIIDLLYKAHLQYLIIDNILDLYGYNKDDSDAIAYSKVTVAYFVFGWCDEWYKRGMKNTPEEMARLFEQGKKQWVYFIAFREIYFLYILLYYLIC